MLIIRLAKVVMVAALAAFAFLVTYDNLVDYGSNYQFVQHVLSMDTTFPDNTLRDRAITNPSLRRAAYATIIAAEGLTCLLLTAGAIALVARLGATADAFNRAKVWAVAGLTVGFGVWFFGFLVVAGEYLAMWQSRSWNGQEAAFRFTMVILGVLIFLCVRPRQMIAATGLFCSMIFSENPVATPDQVRGRIIPEIFFVKTLTVTFPDHALGDCHMHCCDDCSASRVSPLLPSRRSMIIGLTRPRSCRQAGHRRPPALRPTMSASCVSRSTRRDKATIRSAR